MSLKRSFKLIFIIGVFCITATALLFGASQWYMHCGWPNAFSQQIERPSNIPIAKANVDQTSLLASVESNFEQPRYSIAFSYDGKKLASGGGVNWQYGSGNEMCGTVWVLDLNTASVFNAYPVVLNTTLDYGRVNDVTFNPDNTTLAAINWVNHSRLWNVDSYKEPVSLGKPYNGILLPTLAFSPDGQLVAYSASDKTIQIWNMASFDLLTTLKGHVQNVHVLTFSSKGLLASGSADATIRLWNVETGEEVKTLEGHSGDIYHLTFNSQGNLLASSAGDGTTRIWDVQLGEQVHVLPGGGASLRFSLDGSTLAARTFTEFRLWNIESGSLLVEVDNSGLISYQNNELVLGQAMDINPLGDLLAIGWADGKVELRNISTGEVLVVLQDNIAPVQDLAFSPDGTYLAAAIGGKGSVMLWGLQSESKP